MTQPLITLDNITVRLRDRWYLRNTAWEIRQGEQWAVLGPNGSGKTTLARTLAGRIPVVQGKVLRHFRVPDNRKGIGYVASEDRGELFREEGLLDRSRDFSGRVFERTRVADFLKPFLGNGDRDSSGRLDAVCEELKLVHLFPRPLHSLSTGEMTALLIARALMWQPVLLILDEPFDGLDQGSRKRIADVLSRRMTHRMHILLITHRIEELLPAVTHVLLMENGGIAARGEKETMLEKGVLPKPSWETRSGETEIVVPAGNIRPGEATPRGAVLIEMERVLVRFGSVQVLDDVSCTVKAGENWAITGPNGSGKSTLMHLITADELQAYANSIRLFGTRRGSGESIWDIKQKIGLVSHHLFTRYQMSLSVFEVVCSGFFDSIGLYRTCTPEQKASARQWIRRLGIEAMSDVPFSRLSQGQREMVLITRAMVKAPLLLILDEPCAGLDVNNRKKVLDLVELIGSRTPTNLIYATHHPEELLPCISHHLQLESGKVVAAGPV